MTHIQNIKQVTDDSTWKGERELFGNALVIPSKIWNRRPFDCEESDPTWSEKNVGGFTINDAYKPIYQTLLITCYGAYFAGRSLEKIKK